MRFTDLHPVLFGTLDKGRIEFDCPKHVGTGCRVAFRCARASSESNVQGGPPVWGVAGEWPNISLSSSLNFSARTRDGTPTGDPCWHGCIVNGQVQ